MPESGGLIEGRDYVVENGLFVFTAFYLSERGYCCGNGCRHCPYDSDTAEPEEVVSLPVENNS